MKKWTRWQDWVVVACGLYAALSVLWMEPAGASRGLLMTIGILLVVAGVANLASVAMPGIEWAQAVIALALVAAPWMGGFASAMMPAMTAWIAGGVALVATGLALKPSMEGYREHHHRAA
ncbi:SPW repeat domain-containing protein [Zafaria sp. Z1313]|uniref:SPW repeat domain-containing protein n=1 Tax=unclassified Zafaria TaxID=2828765 RepID=UPI002E7A6A9C|nr:SPW repeat protein [Zafaria sp. J156]MEE1622212.1 SPW repeat protein [Zafaria sp. J156]